MEIAATDTCALGVDHDIPRFRGFFLNLLNTYLFDTGINCCPHRIHGKFSLDSTSRERRSTFPTIARYLFRSDG